MSEHNGIDIIPDPDGSTLYLLIDRARETNNVYFLRAIQTADLLSVTEELYVVEAKDEDALSNEELLAIMLETLAALETQNVQHPQVQPTQNGSPILIILLALILLGGGGFLAFKFLSAKKKPLIEEDDEEPEDDKKPVEYVDLSDDEYSEEDKDEHKSEEEPVETDLNEDKDEKSGEKDSSFI